MAHVSRKTYMWIFVALAVLTVLEVLVAYDIVRETVGNLVVNGSLVAMALGKASLVGLFFMHLKHETPVLKITVFVPFLAPALYAVVLIAEAAWRVSAGQLQGVFP